MSNNLSDKLKDEVNGISMGPEMKERVLQNIIGKEKKKKVKKYRFIKGSLELTAACCTFLVCAQLVKSNPELFKINNNSNTVKEDSIEHDDNSQSHSSSNSNTASNKVDEGKNYNQTNSSGKHYSMNEDSKSNIDNDEQNNSVYNGSNNEKNFNVNSNKNTGTSENSSTENMHMGNSDNLINNNNTNDIYNDIHNDDNSNNNINHTNDNLNNTNNGDDNNVNNSNDMNNNSNNSDIENDECSQDSEDDENNNYNLLGGALEGADGNEGSSGDINPEDNACGGSPISEFQTIEEAEQVLNFKADLIKDIDEKYEMSNIIVLSGKTLSIDYSNEDKQFTYRESIDSGDISGDFNKYDYEKNEIVDGNNICLKGNTESIINVATWTNNEKTYSISSENGINYEEVVKMINSIIK